MHYSLKMHLAHITRDSTHLQVMLELCRNAMTQNKRLELLSWHRSKCNFLESLFYKKLINLLSYFPAYDTPS